MFGPVAKAFQSLSKPTIVGIMMASSAIGTALSTHLWMKKVDRARKAGVDEGFNKGLRSGKLVGVMIMADEVRKVPVEDKDWLNHELETAELRATDKINKE